MKKEKLLNKRLKETENLDNKKIKKTKLKIIPRYCTDTGVHIYIETKHRVPITHIVCDNFLLKSKNGNIHRPILCMEELPGHYELTFKKNEIDKIRVETDWYYSYFKKIKS